jgi:hypothetical protein
MSCPVLSHNKDGDRIRGRRGGDRLCVAHRSQATNTLCDGKDLYRDFISAESIDAEPTIMPHMVIIYRNHRPFLMPSVWKRVVFGAACHLAVTVSSA